jgi:LysM repeat protein
VTTPHRPDADGAEFAASDAPRTVAAICIYLLAEDGAWRAARPLREHRCTAASPLAAPSLEKQRRLCLIDDHVRCPAYLIAREALALDRGVSVEDLEAFEERLASRVPRSVPVALDRPSAIAGPLAVVGGTRQATRIGLAAVMLAAGGVLLAARFVGSGPAGSAEATPTASPSPSSSPTASPSPSPSPSASPSPSPSPTPTPSPSPAPKPSASSSPSLPAPTRTYTVQAGDTLIGIAAKFDTTVAILQALNGIDDARLIHTGQVLKIP